MNNILPNPDREITVIFELIGGPFDGTTFVFQDHGQMPSLDRWAEEDQAVAMYRDSSDGHVGKSFRCHCDFLNRPKCKYPLMAITGNGESKILVEYDVARYQDHEYVVTDRLQDGKEVLVRASYSTAPVQSQSTVITGRLSRLPR